jgi:hypothetical protein
MKIDGVKSSLSVVISAALKQVSLINLSPPFEIIVFFDIAALNNNFVPIYKKNINKYISKNKEKKYIIYYHFLPVYLPYA